MPTSMRLGYTVYVTADLFHTETFFCQSFCPTENQSFNTPLEAHDYCLHRWPWQPLAAMETTIREHQSCGKSWSILLGKCSFERVL